jgi:methionyl aminopeptidase
MNVTFLDIPSFISLQPQPSLVQGNEARGWMFPDGWTVATEVGWNFFVILPISCYLTQSGARSAQAEHTVLITHTGVEILT